MKKNKKIRTIMEVISVIKTEKETGRVITCSTYKVSKVENAELKFKTLCLDEGLFSNEIQEGLDDGYAESQNHFISIVWNRIF